MPDKRGKKFRNKVLAAFLAAGFLPLLIISASSLYLVVKTRQQNIVELQNLALNNAEDKVTKYLNEKMEGFNLVISGSNDVGAASVNNLSAIDPNNLIFLIKSIKETAGQIEKINFIDHKGEILAQIDDDGNVVLKRYFGENVPLMYSSNISLAAKIDENKAGADYFLEAIGGKNYFGPLEFIDNKPDIRLASQIKNQDGEIIGIIAAEISLKPVSAIVDQIMIGEKGYVYIADKNGRLVAGTNDNYSAIGDNLNHIALVNHLTSGRKTEIEYAEFANRFGEDTIFSGRLAEELNWYIISNWQKEDAFKVIQNLLSLTLLISIGAILLIIFLAWFFARQIEKPLKSLRYGAKHISEGDLDYRIRIKTGDEFEVLGNRFNDMIKVLKENRKLRDEFVFVAAHELRTPVTAIKGYVSMILDKTFGDVPEKIEENLKIVNNSNERLVQLVQDLLEIARSEAGKLKIEMKDVKISDDIDLVVNELKSLSDEKGINVNYKKPNGDIMVQADSYKLKEVLTNLIGNAIKYTLEVNDIDISHEEKDGFLITHIKDGGIGMTEEEVGQLFSKFYRAQNDDTKKIEGTGLGLFICKEIVERMGGEIWVKSKKGEGSTFSFSLKISA